MLPPGALPAPAPTPGSIPRLERKSPRDVQSLVIHLNWMKNLFFSSMNQISAQGLRAGPGCICSRDGAQPVPHFSCHPPQIQQPRKEPSPPFSPPSWIPSPFPHKQPANSFPGEKFCRGDGTEMDEGTRDKLLRGARSDPKPPVLFLCLSLPRLLQGEAGKGLGGPGRPKPPGPGRAAAASSPTPRRRCGCGPGLSVCNARF